MTILQVWQWNLTLLDELKVPSENRSRLAFLTGRLECLLDSLGDSHYLLVSALHPLSFLMSEWSFRCDPDDARSHDDASLHAFTAVFLRDGT